VFAITVNGAPRVYHLAEFTDGLHVIELAWHTDHWLSADLTTLSQAPPAKIGGALAVSTVTNNEPRLYYTTENDRVQELAWYDGAWHHLDLTGVTGSPLASSNTALVALSVAGDVRVYYLVEYGFDKHIYELALVEGSWRASDLTATTGAPPAAPQTLHAFTIGIQEDPRVYFFGENYLDWEVHELAWYSGGWSHRNLTGDLGVVAATFESPLLGMSVMHSPRVYYMSYTPSGYHVQELAWVVDRWTHSDISARAGGPADANSSVLAGSVAGGGPFTCKLVRDVQHGTLALDADGSFRYAPAAGYIGSDSFTYVANQGAGDSEEITVRIQIRSGEPESAYSYLPLVHR
jgi:hypothetical protein